MCKDEKEITSFKEYAEKMMKECIPEKLANMKDMKKFGLESNNPNNPVILDFPYEKEENNESVL